MAYVLWQVPKAEAAKVESRAVAVASFVNSGTGLGGTVRDVLVDWFWHCRFSEVPVTPYPSDYDFNPILRTALLVCGGVSPLGAGYGGAEPRPYRCLPAHAPEWCPRSAESITARKYL